ncbi:unnamed protein product [Allacma fusca]|uniref:Uncharacterized protein n=1 Tax=Allacma fusca TaxID=39272 RepID=A0A8J2KNJ8_9HEXA|nr:unnamed protein product [Allacma fusca]
MNWKKEQINRWLCGDRVLQVRYRCTISPEVASRFQEGCQNRIQVPRAVQSIPLGSAGNELLCNMDDPIPSSPSTSSSDSSSISNNPNKRRRLDLSETPQQEEEDSPGPSKVRRSRRNVKKPTNYYSS